MCESVSGVIFHSSYSFLICFGGNIESLCLVFLYERLRKLFLEWSDIIDVCVGRLTNPPLSTIFVVPRKYDLTYLTIGIKFDSAQRISCFVLLIQLFLASIEFRVRSSLVARDSGR